jgi:hypothetical protein
MASIFTLMFDYKAFYGYICHLEQKVLKKENILAESDNFCAVVGVITNDMHLCRCWCYHQRHAFHKT